MAYQLADPAVQQFHRQLDTGQYEVICGQAAQGFCASGAAGDAMPVLKGVHEKLGNTVSAKRGAWNVGSTTSGTFVRIQYNTTFALGPGVETFTWIKIANTFKLYGYNVQSNALLKPAAKNLYFVPIGDTPTTEISKLIAHYQEKFGIEARILPSIAPSANDMDENRQQFIAESLIQTMTRDYANLATDGSSVLIGITGQDMYPRGEGWQFCFGWRITDARAAIVSTARMNLDYPGEPITEAKASRGCP